MTVALIPIVYALIVTISLWIGGHYPMNIKRVVNALFVYAASLTVMVSEIPLTAVTKNVVITALCLSICILFKEAVPHVFKTGGNQSK